MAFKIHEHEFAPENEANRVAKLLCQAEIRLIIVKLETTKMFQVNAEGRHGLGTDRDRETVSG